MRILSVILLSGCILFGAVAQATSQYITIEEKVLNDPDALVRLPRAGTNPSGHGPVWAQGTIAELGTSTEVSQYVREALPFMPSHLRMRVNDALNAQALNIILYDIGEITGVTCTEAVQLNGELWMSFEYDERARVMGLYRRFVNADEEQWYYTGHLYADIMGLREDRNHFQSTRARRKAERSGSSSRRNARQSDSQPKPRPNFSDLTELCCYIISAMPYCPPDMELTCPDRLTDRQLDVLKLAIKAYSKSIGGDRRSEYFHIRQVKTQDDDNILYLNFSYTEHDLLYAAYRGFITEERLSKQQQEGLHLAKRLAEEIRERHTFPYHRALAAHDALVLNCSYQLRENQNLVSDMLTTCRGKCAHYAATYSLLLNMLDIECLQVDGVTTQRKAAHCWNMVYLDGVWAQVDVTWDDPLPDVPGRLLHAHFLMTDATRKGGVDAASYKETESEPLEKVEEEQEKKTDRGKSGKRTKSGKSAKQDKQNKQEKKRKAKRKKLEGLEWEVQDFPQCTDESLDYRKKFANRYETVEEMVTALVKQRHATEGPVLLEATVAELTTKPERVFELVRKALIMKGSSLAPIVDCSARGEVTLFCN